MTDRRQGLVVVVFALLIAGVLLGDPWVLGLAIVPLSLLALDALAGVPEPDLQIERTVAPKNPPPGDTASVTLSVTNVGNTPLPDVRIADGVPESTPVVDGSARGCRPLRSGETLTVEYSVRARPELHEFDPPTVTLRNLGGCSARTLAPAVDGDDTISPAVPYDNAPDRADSKTIGGRQPVAESGEGIEFYRTREYRAGDPRNRVDWRRFAKTGELATIEFRERGGAAVVVVVDARSVGRVAPAPTAPTGRSLSLYVGAQLVTAAGSQGADLGVAAFSTAGRLDWLPVGGDPTAATGLLRAVADDEHPPQQTTALDFAAAAPSEPADWLESRLPSVATVVLVTPLYDDAPVDFAARVRAHGRSISVVSPSAEKPSTPGAQIGAVERQARIERLGAAGVAVTDWSPAEPVPTILQSLEVGTL